MEDSISERRQVQTENDDFSADYANNVYFAPNIWDLKLLFGELSGTKQAIDWHTSITLPWAQAKLMAYFLAVNIAAQEANNGQIRIPKSMWPPAPPPPAEGDFQSAATQAFYEQIKALHQKFIAENKE